MIVAAILLGVSAGLSLALALACPPRPTDYGGR